MTATVSITAVHTAQPPYWVETAEAAARVGAAVGEPRLAAAIARSSGIERRATALPAEALAQLGSIGARNEVYRSVAPALALSTARCILVDNPRPLGCMVSSSCTGYMVPGWDVLVATELALPNDLVRLPITQAGCAGGLLAIAQAADFVRLHPARSALAMSVELCSLAFHASREPGNLVSALLFGDGAAAALLQPGGDGLQVVDHRSALVPDSMEALGFDLTDQGFYPRLSLDLADTLIAPLTEAVAQILAANELSRRDVSFFLVHPGGPRILNRVQETLAIRDEEMSWSRESLRNLGNTSSAAIFDVLERYLADQEAPRGLGLMVAFGPGVSIELLLVNRC